MKHLGRLFFAIVFVVTSSHGGALAKAPQCGPLFLPTISEILSTIDNKNHQFVLSGQSTDVLLKDYSWIRKRKIRHLLHEINLSTLASEAAVERYAVELNTALFGKRDILDRWIYQTKDSRLEESTSITIKEQLLQEGLKKQWLEVRDPRTSTFLSKSLDNLWKLQGNRVFSLLSFPWTLPTAKNKKIPSELMLAIIKDGFQVHAEEAKTALGAQDKIEAYNTFRRLYSSSILGFVLIFQMHSTYQQLQEVHVQQVESVLQQFKTTQSELIQLTGSLKQEQIEIAYKSAEEEFVQKWGEPPTSDERTLIQKRIAAALGNEAKILHK